MILLLLYSSYTVYNLYRDLNEKKAEYNSVQNKIKEENKLAGELIKQKNAINSDEYIERIAREKLGFVKTGEKVFVDINK